MNPIPIEIFQQKLLAFSPTLFTEVLQQTNLPPFLQKQVYAWDADTFALLRSPQIRADGVNGKNTYVCTLTSPTDSDTLTVLLENLLPVQEDGDALYLCLPEPIPEKWREKAGTRFYEAVGVSHNIPSAVVTGLNQEILSTLTTQRSHDTSEAGDIADCLALDMQYMLCDEQSTTRFLGYMDGENLLGALSLSHDTCVYIHNLYVHPAYRRRGIGTALLRAAVSLYPGERYVYSHWWDNGSSGKTAVAAGFVPVGCMIQFR